MLKVFEYEADVASITAALWDGGSKSACLMHKSSVSIHPTFQPCP
jgi:hypothetical protein